MPPDHDVSFVGGTHGRGLKVQNRIVRCAGKDADTRAGKRLCIGVGDQAFVIEIAVDHAVAKHRADLRRAVRTDAHCRERSCFELFFLSVLHLGKEQLFFIGHGELVVGVVCCGISDQDTHLLLFGQEHIGFDRACGKLGALMHGDRVVHRRVHTVDAALCKAARNDGECFALVKRRQDGDRKVVKRALAAVEHAVYDLGIRHQTERARGMLAVDARPGQQLHAAVEIADRKLHEVAAHRHFEVQIVPGIEMLRGDKKVWRGLAVGGGGAQRALGALGADERVVAHIPLHERGINTVEIRADDQSRSGLHIVEIDLNHVVGEPLQRGVTAGI